MKNFQKVYYKVCYGGFFWFFFFINYANLATYIPRVLTQFKANNYFINQHACRGLEMRSQSRREKSNKINTVNHAEYFQMPFNLILFTGTQLNTLGIPVKQSPSANCNLIYLVCFEF